MRGRTPKNAGSLPDAAPYTEGKALMGKSSSEALSEERNPHTPEPSGLQQHPCSLAGRENPSPTPTFWKTRQVLGKAVLDLLGVDPTSSGHQTDNQGGPSARTSLGSARRAEHRKGLVSTHDPKVEENSQGGRIKALRRPQD